jgi:hypothetical protein
MTRRSRSPFTKFGDRTPVVVDKRAVFLRFAQRIRALAPDYISIASVKGPQDQGGKQPASAISKICRPLHYLDPTSFRRERPILREHTPQESAAEPGALRLSGDKTS